MPNVKLFLYKASQAPIVAILRRGSTKNDWELIRWDLETDTFTEGQWILGKIMNGKYMSISPDGKYFAYHYDQYPNGEWKCEGVVSRLPNFTALYFNKAHVGNWETYHFTNDGKVVFDPTKLLPVGPDAPLTILPYSKDLENEIEAGGYIDQESWVDPKGRVITKDGGKILADGGVLYDTSNHVFEARAPLIL